MEAGAEEKGIGGGVAPFAEVVSNESVSFPSFCSEMRLPSQDRSEIVAFQVC